MGRQVNDPSDLLPTVADPNATTKTPKRKTMAIKLSPETTANIQLGSIITGAVALVVGTIFVWTIKTNGEQALAEIKNMREDQKPMAEKVHRLWSDYEWRLASGHNTALPGVNP